MQKINNNKLKKNRGQIALHIIFVLLCVVYIAPLLLVVAASFSSEEALLNGGFSLLPKEFTTAAYAAVFKKPAQILASYRTTAIYSFINAFLSAFIMGLLAYPLARSNFKWKKPINAMLLFTMLFSGGMVPSYILNTRYLHLGNSMWIYILPSLVNTYNVFVMRAGFKGIPEELIDAAKVDGASELFICFKIIFPLGKATLATIMFLDLVGNWNSWTTTSIYIQNPDLYSLQYLLQRILRDTEFMKQMADEGLLVGDIAKAMPLESLRYAMAVVIAGPMLFIFPFFQKHFVKGIALGAVKG